MTSEYNSSAYQQYLEKRHKKFTTPDEVIASFVQNATDSFIQEQQRIMKGENNEVYTIVLENEREIIVRINHTNMMSFKREQWAIEQCRRIGIPVPEILALEEVPLDTHPINICIETKVTGNNFSDDEFSKLPKETQKKLLYQAGTMLSRIHTIPTKGFGELDEKGEGEDSDFYEYLIEREKDKWFLLELADKHGIERDVIEKTYETIKQHAHLFKNTASVLTHGDFRPDHIFYANDTVSGIIDFENARGVDPIDEFARWDYYYHDEIPLTFLQDGYTNKAIFDENFPTKLHVLKLLWSIILLYYNDSVENPTGIEMSKKNFTSSLKFLTE